MSLALSGTECLDSRSCSDLRVQHCNIETVMTKESKRPTNIVNTFSLSRSELLRDTQKYRVVHADWHVSNQLHERLGRTPYIPYDQAIRDLRSRVKALEKAKKTKRTNGQGDPPPYDEQRNAS